MKIKITSLLVNDQDKALKFYTEILGFSKKREIPAGQYKWLTVESTVEPNGVELLLEPNVNPAAQTYQEALFNQGIPATSFEVDDLEGEFKRLSGQGVRFFSEPSRSGPVAVAVFEDTCGNLIQLYQL